MSDEKAEGDEAREECCEPEAERAEDTQEQQEDQPGEKGKFQAFVNDTTCIAMGVGSTLGEAFKGIAHICRGRNNVVMVRVNDESLKRIDQLVDSGIFRSRSESAAYLIARGIEADTPLFEKLREKVEEIHRLREELRQMVNPGPEPGGEAKGASGEPG